ncbi:MAG: tautomerase family protein [Limnohabitans sp.]
MAVTSTAMQNGLRCCDASIANHRAIGRRQAPRPGHGLAQDHHEKENEMPTLRVELFAGRTPAQKAQLAQALTQACVRVLGSDPAGVEIVFFDIERHDWATGGRLWSEAEPASSADS